MESKINIETSEDRAKVRELHNINSGIDETRNAHWKPTQHESPSFFGTSLDRNISALAKEYQQSRENLKTTLQEYAKWLDEVIEIFEETEAGNQANAKQASAQLDSTSFATEVRQRETIRSTMPAGAVVAEVMAKMRSDVLDFLAKTETP